VALDQRTGKVVWSVQTEPWQNGFSITAAPLYYDGLVIQGLSGGEMGVRGRVKAYDAKTGAPRWTFYTIPGPGEIGHETWPPQGDAWQHGGAAVWQTPTVDPELGLIYFSTGNPGPNLFGAVRPGANLFTVSIVALEAKSGKYRWHFQQIHHDIWDYDSPNPTVLFDTVIRGARSKDWSRCPRPVGPTSWTVRRANRSSASTNVPCRRSRGRPPRRRSRIRAAMRSCRSRSTSCRRAPIFCQQR